MERTLITGGAGFLGSHLCDYLIEKGHEVICIDNLSTGNMENISHLLGKKRFSFIQYDVTNYLHVDGELHNILHFASPASPIDYLRMPIQTLKVGSLGTHKALGLALSKKARFLLASTSECYGDPLVHPQTEDYWGNVNPVGPRGVYDEAKRFAESMTMAYHRYHGVETRIVRIFNTYGPRMRLEDGRALPAFMGQPQGRGPDRFWRRHPDPELLLRRRSGRGHLPASFFRRGLPGQPGQPRRNHPTGAGAPDFGGYRFEEPDRIPAPARGRPEGQAARHREGKAPARLGAAGLPGRGIAAGAAVLPEQGAVGAQERRS